MPNDGFQRTPLKPIVGEIRGHHTGEKGMQLFIEGFTAQNPVFGLKTGIIGLL